MVYLHIFVKTMIMYISKNTEIVVKNVIRLREEKGWNRSELGRRSGVDQSHISRYEKGDRHIGTESLEKIANAFGIEMYELFYYRSSEEYSMRDKLELIQTLHPLKQELIETMINAFLKEQEMETLQS
jgi:transcriptional regulator with XRE-family HTH domain